MTISEKIKLLTLHSKLVLFVIAILEETTTGEMYRKYIEICKDLRKNPRTTRMIRKIITKLKQEDLIYAEVKYNGWKKGTTSCIKLEEEKVGEIIKTYFDQRFQMDRKVYNY